MIEKGFKFIDLFCGIGGFHQAMSSLGGECVMASDIDKHCQETYFENYGIRPIGDITKVEASDIQPFDVLCAGFPCQAFSLAGKKLGFADETRGTLFFDVIRIAEYHKPRYMLLENVKNLANHDGGRTWEIIYNAIREIGYNVLETPVIFSPHYLGIPQTRERVFIMCVREDIGTVPEFYFDKKSIPECDPWKYIQDDDEIENIDTYRIPKKYEELCNHWDKLIKIYGGELPCPTINAKYLMNYNDYTDYDSLPDHIRTVVKRNHAMYNANKPALERWLEWGKNVEMFKGCRLQLEWNTDKGPGVSVWDNFFHLRQSGLRVRRPIIFPTLVASDTRSVIGPRKRYMTPRECARIQSFPDTFKINPKDRVAYKQFGNSVNVEVVTLMAKYMFGDKDTREKYSKPVK